MAKEEDEKCLKCIFVGNAAVGKTSMIVSYTTNVYPHNYVPTAFDNFSVVVLVDKKPIRLQLHDTAGQVSDSLIFWVILATGPTDFIGAIAVSIKSCRIDVMFSGIKKC